jgi:uncharacterized repeat protein (TIGR03803 family)
MTKKKTIVRGFVLAFTVACGLAQAQTYTKTDLYTFSGGSDGANPVGPIVLDAAGNVYGVTAVGGLSGPSCPGGAPGNAGCGTLYKVDPGGHETVLHAFGQVTPDVVNPASGLIQDSGGNLYGTGFQSGTCKDGTLPIMFRIDAAGVETLFCSSLNLNSFGEFGGVARIDTSMPDTNSLSLLYSFSATSDGYSPVTGLALDGGGNAYASGHGISANLPFVAGAVFGTTILGGDLTCNPPNGCGTVFKVDASGVETTLWRFAGGDDGLNPAGGVVFDAAGNLYGMTNGGGLYDQGTVFKIDTAGTKTILWNFLGSDGGFFDGDGPLGTLALDTTGNLYGETAGGGDNNGGTVFELSPSQAGSWTESILYSFPGAGTPEGQSGNLIIDSAGNIYGTTIGGITSTPPYGEVFKLSPQPCTQPPPVVRVSQCDEEWGPESYDDVAEMVPDLKVHHYSQALLSCTKTLASVVAQEKHVQLRSLGQ